MREYWVYIISNVNNNVIYIGVTNDLERRIYEHKNKIFKGFSQKYNLSKLVYCESTERIEDAICREKQLKGWRRSKKDELINTINPQLHDLSADWF